MEELNNVLIFVLLYEHLRINHYAEQRKQKKPKALIVQDFMSYALDWNSSNDTPIDEDTANAVMNAARNIYTNLEYIPYSQYK